MRLAFDYDAVKAAFKDWKVTPETADKRPGHELGIF